MPDLPLKALDIRQQKLVENAGRAFAQGKLDYVLTACAQVLQDAPGCLPVRKLLRAAQVRQFSGRGGWMSKALKGLTALPFAFGSGRRDPAAMLVQANSILSKDPYSITGLNLLAEVAVFNEWPETAAFALEAIRELEPTDRRNLLALGEAWLRAKNPDAALQVADELLRLNPVDGDAQTLMRKASIDKTTRLGHWESDGSYREKLSNEAESVALGKAARLTRSDLNPPESDEPVAPPATVDDVQTAQELVDRHPLDADARFRLAELLLVRGEIEHAIAQYQQVQKVPKLRVRSLLGLARCFRSRGLHDLAIAQLRTAKSELATLDDLKKEVVYELGSVLEQDKQGEAAIAEFKEIYREDIGFRDVAAKINAHYA
ncbi:MAG: tetratricopeptide repeat protein [Cephaloticoccus sp.]|nr:tetratricopeptide repeat protein [Cephaloticoccus sp.]MCF7760633.1 tetratricopeptide repeat protein [Cephaloticoccus sp.]